MEDDQRAKALAAVRGCVREGRPGAAEAAEVLKGAGPSAAVDALWVVALAQEQQQQTQSSSSGGGGGSSSSKKEDAARLVELVRAVAAAGACDPSTLRQYLEPELLEVSGLIASAKRFNMKTVKANVESLKIGWASVRDEAEGFVRLFAALADARDVADGARRVRAVVGRFELDPERAVLLSLHWADAAPQSQRQRLVADTLAEALIPHQPHVIRAFAASALQQHQRAEAAHATLFKLLASLLCRRSMQLDDIWPLLAPSDSAEAALRDAALDQASSQLRAKLSLVKQTPAASADATTGSLVLNQRLLLAEALAEREDDGWAMLADVLHRARRSLPGSCNKLLRTMVGTLSRRLAPFYEPLSPNPDPAIQPQPLSPAAVATLSAEVFPFLHELGGYIGRDAVFFQKLCRLVAACVAVPGLEAAALDRLHELVGSVLLPALMVVGPNAGAAIELWGAMKHVPWRKRFSLYAELQTTLVPEFPELLQAHASTVAEVRKLDKRLKADNAKQMGKLIVKLCHHTTLSVVNHFLERAEFFPNWIVPIADAFKLLTPLSFDMLGFALVERLLRDRPRIQEADGVSIAGWLSNLSVFIGTLYRKYDLPVAPLLFALTDAIHAGDAAMVTVLQQLVFKMTAIETVEELETEQAQSLAGGETLKLVTSPASAGQVVIRKTSAAKRLMEALHTNNLAIPLFVAIANQGDAALFRQKAAHLKLMCNAYDMIQQGLLNYSELLAQFSTRHISLAVPSLQEAVLQFHGRPEPTFQLLRHRLLEDFLKPDPDAWKGVCSSVADVVPPSTLSVLSPELYTTFWTLGLYDIFVPREHYSSQTKKLTEQIAACKKALEMHLPDSDRKKKEKEKKQLEEAIAELASEKSKQDANNEAVLAKLKSLKSMFFPAGQKFRRVQLEIGQHLIFRRALWSVPDALYSARFFLLLHSLDTPQFFTAMFIESMMRLIPTFLRCATENEASHIGYFMKELLAPIYRWIQDASAWQKEFQALTGGAMSTANPSQKVPRPNFTRSTFVWDELIKAQIVEMMQSKEYLEIRNALIFVARLTPIWPIFKDNAAHVLEQTKALSSEAEKREDIRVLALRCTSTLEKASNSWLAVPKPAAAAAAPAVSATSTPASKTTTTATAPAATTASPQTPSKTEEAPKATSTDKERRSHHRHEKHEDSKSSEKRKEVTPAPTAATVAPPAAAAAATTAAAAEEEPKRKRHEHRSSTSHEHSRSESKDKKRARSPSPSPAAATAGKRARTSEDVSSATQQSPSHHTSKSRSDDKEHSKSKSPEKEKEKEKEKPKEEAKQKQAETSKPAATPTAPAAEALAAEKKKKEEEEAQPAQKPAAILPKTSRRTIRISRPSASASSASAPTPAPATTTTTTASKDSTTKSSRHRH